MHMNNSPFFTVENLLDLRILVEMTGVHAGGLRLVTTRLPGRYWTAPRGNSRHLSLLWVRLPRTPPSPRWYPAMMLPSSTPTHPSAALLLFIYPHGWSEFSADIYEVHSGLGVTRLVVRRLCLSDLTPHNLKSSIRIRVRR